MSADFWAGYVSGAASIIIGNPLDLVKTRLQAGSDARSVDSTSTAAPHGNTFRGQFDRAGTLVRGATVPIITYGALNALLFVTYNRTLALLSSTAPPTPDPSYAKIWLAGATGGLASFVVSAPTELIKCRAQVSTAQNVTSWSIARDTWRREGIRGLYYGGGITSVRDAVGYGFYFWSYEWSKHALGSPDDTDRQAAMKVLLCGGFAGVVTWASIFPLDVVKTRVQTQVLHAAEPPARGEQNALLGPETQRRRLSSIEIARQAYRSEGAGVFFRGLGICSVRAFVVNAVQWAVYEWMMRFLQQP
ncbi:solute carrier family 25 protein [Dothidotthia symphoricarpi CBS 119687]|uniref:Solute carrier family 25 protein n=1 Tax=Dothidotthia symphoricarpi CBS 119687 TaxID=1392245 RepID=A0A6A6AVS9_9PLEO|nr:solute carrier family 25 protein [Dothidotthia symphoricarpi CBS 119687]KAF2134631.1 solute carrier family 25 protein [Dothidotthia symphoricarpi CBS 119687]